MHDCCLDRDIISSRGFSEHHLTGQSISFWCLCAALQSPPPPLLLDYHVRLQVCTPASCCRSCFCICNISKCFSHLARECLGTRSAHACMPARMRDAWVWVGTGRGSGFYQPRFDFPPRPCRHHPSRFQRSGSAANRSCAQSYSTVYSVCSSSSLLAGSCRQMMMAGLADETKIPHSCTEHIIPYSLCVFESESVTLPLTLVMFSSTGSEMPWAWRPHNLPTRCSTARFIGTVITCFVRGKCQARVLELRQTGKVLAGAIVADWFPVRLLSSATAAVPTPDRPITPTPVHVARTRKSPNRHLVAPRQTFETASTIF